MPNFHLNFETQMPNFGLCYFQKDSTFFSFKQDSGVSAADDQAQVSTEMANRMSLFYAYPTPMLKTLSDATSKFVSEVCSSIFVCAITLRKSCQKLYGQIKK